jgi:hypothetical protein
VNLLGFPSLFSAIFHTCTLSLLHFSRSGRVPHSPFLRVGSGFGVFWFSVLGVPGAVFAPGSWVSRFLTVRLLAADRNAIIPAGVSAPITSTWRRDHGNLTPFTRPFIPSGVCGARNLSYCFPPTLCPPCYCPASSSTRRSLSACVHYPSTHCSLPPQSSSIRELASISFIYSSLCSQVRRQL